MQAGPEEKAASCSPSCPGVALLHHLFETQARARPDALAIDQGGERITYGELDRYANQLAQHLHAGGICRGARVAILLPRGVHAYASLLAVLKTGAAYVPLDPDYPAERLAYILDDSGAEALVASGAHAAACPAFSGSRVRVDADAAAITARSGRGPPALADSTAHDLCYIIYTSGSTGRPKGVMVEHRNAVHLVTAEGALFAVRPEDRVYQGASLSFDLSVEEVWLAFHAGATIVPATPELARAGPDLARLLGERGVTVLSCVPSLLSMLSEDVPSLRLLILGGESCPPHLIERWARPWRRIVNTYGPTETTVIATYAELAPDEPVSIGHALSGYSVHLLDDALQPVTPGAVGEICIGGAGVARGYVGMPQETAVRFVPDPFSADADARLYRSGDLGRMNGLGALEFVGRADAQVKIRGFRVELTEVESALSQAPGVAAAACALREDQPGRQYLAAYVMMREGAAANQKALRTHLRQRLPGYMVPSLIEAVDGLPRLPSGKLDRGALPPPRRHVTPPDAARPPRSGTERRLATIWAALFAPQRVGVEDDFFLDLGGHSLLAARAVSELRKLADFARVSVRDIYEHPTIAALAAHLDGAAPAAQPASRERRRADTANAARRHASAGAIQFGALYVTFALGAFYWVTPYLAYFLLVGASLAPIAAMAWAALAAVLVVPALCLVGIATKWLLLGRIRPGRHPLWGGYYLRWWFVQNVINAAPLDYLLGTPWLAVYLRLLGARVGDDVHLDSRDFAAFDLISIGDGTTISERALLLGYVIEGSELVIGPLTIGPGCYVGTCAVLPPGVVMEDNARVEDLSLIAKDARIRAGETWAGSPAQPARRTRPAPPPRACGMRRIPLLMLYGALILVLPLALLVAVVPGMALLTHIDPLARPLHYLAAMPAVGASFVVVLAGEVVLLKWLLVGRVRAGLYPVHGSFYLRNWVVEQLMLLGLHLIGPVRATLYAKPWYRALGARVGKFVELSTATSATPDLLDLSDGSTVADDVSLGSPHIEGGWMSVAPTRLGRRAFVGNSGVVPAGTAMGEQSLIGVLSLAPARPESASRVGTAWLGSPPLPLPHWQPSAVFSDQRTYQPSRKLQWARGAFELLRVTLPPAGFVFVAASVVIAVRDLWLRLGPGAALALAPLAYGAGCAAVMLAVVLAKWGLVGRFRDFERPLWTFFIWRLELVNALYEFLATPLVLADLRGTPLLPWYLRALGARIGRQACLHTTGFLEFDLVEIGDRAALNHNCVVQTHLFEDRVLKAARLRIGADCDIGAASVVLYGSVMEDGARLDALSLLMKGERLPAGTAWAGSPAEWGERGRD